MNYLFKMPSKTQQIVWGYKTIKAGVNTYHGVKKTYHVVKKVSQMRVRIPLLGI